MYSTKLHLLCYDDSTSMVLMHERKRRGGRQHKGSLFSGPDKSEVSFWIFNILQGTKQSYSGLVSEFSFLGGGGLGCRGLIHVSVNCCMLLSQLLCGFAWVASTKTWEINLWRNTSCARCGTWGKKGLPCIRDSKGLNIIKPCWNEIFITNEWSDQNATDFEFLLVILGGFSKAKQVKSVSV